MDEDRTYIGMPCKHCRSTLRYKINRNCVECHRAAMRRKAVGKKLPIKVKWPYTPEQQARLTKKTYYGRMCVNGHDGLRYISSNNCVLCQKERNDPENKRNRQREARLWQERFEADMLQRIRAMRAEKEAALLLEKTARWSLIDPLTALLIL